MGKTCIYIELNSEKMKLIEVKKGVMTKSVEIEAKEHTINDGELVDITKTADYIKGIIKKNKMKANAMGVCLNSSQNIVRQFKIPFLKKEEEVIGAIEVKLYETLPNILDSHYMSYKVYDKGEDTISGMVALAPKAVLRTYYALAKKLKMKLEVIDVAANCAAKYVKNTNKGEVSAIYIEMGHTYTNLTLVNQGRVLINRFIVNGVNLAELVLQKEYKLERDKIEDCLRGKYKEFGINRSQMKLLMNESFTDINNILNQFMDYVKYNKVDENFQGIVVYGEYGNSHYIKDYFADRYNIEVQHIMGDDRSMLNLRGCAIRE